MKRRALLIVVLTASVALTWLVLRRPKPAGEEIAVQSPAPPATNDPKIEPANAAPPAMANTNQFVRPPDVDEDHWNRLMLVRQTLLERNQPVEFYARVLDQGGQPVPGAALKLRLARVDEAFFATTNFFHMELGKEVVNISMELISDAQGWLELKGVTGSSVSIWGLSKEGYTSNLPDGKYGGVSYEPGGRRNPSGHILMTNAWNPAKGYVFHMWKRGESEKLIPFHFAVPVDLDSTNWYGIDFFRGVIEGGMPGDFRFWFLTTNDASGNPARRFRFEVPGGGLQSDDKPYPYEAPAEGYASGLDWVYEPFGQHAKGNPPDTLVRRFYVRGRNGKIYASVTWNFVASTISGYLNPSASRNLAPDPEKAITDPQEIRRLDATTRL